MNILSLLAPFPFHFLIQHSRYKTNQLRDQSADVLTISFYFMLSTFNILFPLPLSTSMMATSTKGQRASRGDEECHGYEAIFSYCAEKKWSPPGNNDAASDVHLKENIGNNFDENSDIKKLSFKSQSLRKSPKPKAQAEKTRIGAPDKKYVFQDKENFEGKRSLDSRKKKNQGGDGKTLRKLKEDKARLQHQLKQKDDELIETQNLASKKGIELKEMSSLVSNLRDLLRGMATGETNGQLLDICPELSDIVKSCSTEKSNDHNAMSNLQMALKDNEREINGLKEHLRQGLDIMSSQGNVIDSLKNLNVDREHMIASLTQLVNEKDQAIAEITEFYEANDCANKKILSYSHDKHKKAINKVQIKYDQDIVGLEEKNIQLLESLSKQSRLVTSLKDLNEDSIQTIASLTQLINEKDEAIAEISQFNEMNECANRKLLARTNEKYEEKMHEMESSMKNLHHMLSLKLREKFIYQRELELLKHQLDDATQMNSEQIQEIKFVVTFLLICHLLMGFVWRQEWIFYISPVYFLFILFNLE